MDPLSTLVAGLVGLMLILCLFDLGVSVVVLRAAVAAVNGMWRTLVGSESTKEASPVTSRKVTRGKKRAATRAAVPEPTVSQAIRVSLIGILAQLATAYLSGAAAPSIGLVEILALVRVVTSVLVIPFVLETTFPRAVLVAIVDTFIRFVLLGGVGMLVASLVWQS